MAIETVRVSNLSHVKQVLFNGAAARDEFAYNGSTITVAFASRSKPYVEMEAAVAARLLMFYGNPAANRDGGLYEHTSENAMEIAEALAKYAKDTGSDAPPSDSVRQGVVAHPILGFKTAFSPALSSMIGGMGGPATAEDAFRDPRIRARASNQRPANIAR